MSGIPKCVNRHVNMSFSIKTHVHSNAARQFDLISSSRSTSEGAAFGLFRKGAVLGSIPKLWERATGQSAHQHRRSEHSAQTWLDTTAQSQRPSDTRTMDLSDRLPIWPPPRIPSTFLAQRRCSAAKGAWVRVECLPLKPPPHHKRSTVTHSHEDREKVAKQ